MSGFSTFFAQQVINSSFVNGGTKYLALFTSDPTDLNVTANEVSGAWYGRQAISSWSAPVGSGVSTSNSNQITYSAVTGSPVTVTHWGLYDASVSGNLIASGPLSASKVLNIDDVFVVNAGQLTLTFD